MLIGFGAAFWSSYLAVSEPGELLHIVSFPFPAIAESSLDLSMQLLVSGEQQEVPEAHEEEGAFFAQQEPS